MPQHTIVGLGEILWDMFPTGPRFGGAPANFACSAAGLGGRSAAVSMVSSVGTDQLGHRALEALRQRHVDTTWVTSQSRPTGKVNVTLDDRGVASYQFASDTAWDHLPWSSELAELAAGTHAVCFGTLGQREATSRDTIQRFVAETPPTTLRIFDINLRPPFHTNEVILASLRLANVLKLNDDELPRLAEICHLSGSEREVMQQLSEQFVLEMVALTKGEQGAMLLREDEFDRQPSTEIEVIDTVGAGDAFTAALTLGLLAGDPLPVINRRACAAAAFVCGRSGATPVVPELATFDGT